MKVAKIQLIWRKSPSPDVKSVQVVVVNDGLETRVDLPPEIEELNIDVKASKTFSFQVVTKDSEGMEGSSSTYLFTLGDLEAPLPATELGHKILAISEDSETPPPPEGGRLRPPG